MGLAKTLYEGYFTDLDGGAVGREVMGSVRKHEGYRGMPYKDSLGKETIGVGTLLPLNEEEAMLVALCRAHDMAGELSISLNDRADISLAHLPTPVRNALTGMAFQLGVPRLLGFKRMLAAIREGRWAEAAEEAMDSRWAKQTPVRAKHVAQVLRREARR